jgi:DNA-binding response OmpR family regulator
MQKKWILVADDQNEILSLLNDSLSNRGFEVVLCRESKNALYLIKSLKPALILLDLMMPDVNGFEICEILNKDPETCGIPIIIISGFDDEIAVKKAYKLGVVGYFVKPFALSDLCNEIEKVLANKEKPL